MGLTGQHIAVLGGRGMLGTDLCHALRAAGCRVTALDLPEFDITRADHVGQSIAGTLLPNCTYMVGFENPAAREAAWAAFIKHPEWEKMKNDPKYADTVSRITNLILRPLPGSQI